MADEPQDTTEDPEEAGDGAEEAAADEPSPSGETDDATGGEGTGPSVEQDAEGVAEVTEHSTKLSESERPDPLSPGQPRGVDPGSYEDMD